MGYGRRCSETRFPSARTWCFDSFALLDRSTRPSRGPDPSVVAERSVEGLAEVVDLIEVFHTVLGLLSHHVQVNEPKDDAPEVGRGFDVPGFEDHPREHYPVIKGELAQPPAKIASADVPIEFVAAAGRPSMG